MSGPGAGESRLVLHCFAHAGGGGGFFRPWRARLAPEIDVRPVVLPGRESRTREEPFRSMPPLVTDVVGDLVGRLEPPYALFGHSLGAIVAFEVALALRRCGQPEPAGLVVSGRRAPQLPSRRPPLSDLGESQLVARVAELGGTPANLLAAPDLLRLFLPTLRADFAINETYRPTADKPLSCPVFGFVGDRDPLTTADEVAGWRTVTTGRFGLRVFRGDHFYLQDAPAGVTAAVRSDLLGARRARSRYVPDPRSRPTQGQPLLEDTMTAPIWDAEFEALVREHIPTLPADHPLSPDLSFAAFGLDSIGMVALIAGLEDSYAMTVPDEDMRPSRFATPTAAWETVRRCRTGDGGPR